MYNEIANTFRLHNYSVFPVLITGKSATHPDSGLIKVVSGVRNNGKWHYTDHYGNLMDWLDCFEYLEKQIFNLELLVSVETPAERRYIWNTLNNSKINVVGFNEADFLEIGSEGITSRMETKDIAENSPRWQREYWEPILAAWKHSCELLQKMYANNELTN